MAKRNRYKEMEGYMTMALIADGGLFLLYLIFAGFGVGWLKVVTAVLCILLSAACLGYLYLTRELLRKRSLWMSTAAVAVVLCVVISLIAGFPSPNKHKIPDTGSQSVSDAQ